MGLIRDSRRSDATYQKYAEDYQPTTFAEDYQPPTTPSKAVQHTPAERLLAFNPPHTWFNVCMQKTTRLQHSLIAGPTHA